MAKRIELLEKRSSLRVWRNDYKPVLKASKHLQQANTEGQYQNEKDIRQIYLNSPSSSERELS